jgi:PAS domain S-box-containing protein
MNNETNANDDLTLAQDLADWAALAISNTRLLQQAQEELAERTQAAEQLRYQASLLANVSDAIISTDLEDKIRSWNRAAEVIYGWSAAEVIGKRMDDIVPTTALDADVIQEFRQVGQWCGAVAQMTKAGRKRVILSSVTLLHDAAGEPTGAVAVNRDITAQVQTTTALQASQQLIQSTLDSLRAHICVLDETGTIIAVNNLWKAFAQANGASIEKVGEGVNYLHVCEATQGEERSAALAFAAGVQAVVRGECDYFEAEYPCHSPQEQRWFMERVTPLIGSPTTARRVVIAHENITALKQLEAANEQLTAQFYQAQKMESIGRLAGGIAHDFNNLLMPILGYAALGMRKVGANSQSYTDFKRIKEAGERAAGLTRQILAFSRQQMLEMKILDLNQVIARFVPMLQRLIGEDIVLETCLAAGLPSIKADEGQLDQVLLNLAINARDAMVEGGTLTIETMPVTIDETYAASHIDVQPGAYALLAVSDTGDGMDAATQQRIFEPFFTTKPPGQGTGLGLATVFGIVKQHQGTIWVYSEVGHGTTFKLYLPLVEGPHAPAELVQPAVAAFDGSETVLLVEDETSVRQLIAEILREQGYHVLETGEPQQGVNLAAAYAGPIHLLLSDVIMPQMNGHKLYQQLVAMRPELKVLFISGYTDNIITMGDVPTAGIAFLQKPFTLESLLLKIRTVLRG